MMIVDFEKLREIYWEELVKFMTALKPEIEHMYRALNFENEELLSDQMSIVLRKLLQGHSKIMVLRILDSIGNPDL